MGNTSGAYNFNQYSWPPPGKITCERFVTDGEYIAKGSFRVCYRGKDTVTGQPVVLKTFIEHNPMEETYWTEDIQASRVAQEFAKQFNTEMKTSKPIRFIQPVVYECPSNICKPFVKGGKVLVEPYLGENIYKKFNSNSGWESTECGLSMAAFSHFT